MICMSCTLFALDLVSCEGYLVKSSFFYLSWLFQAIHRFDFDIGTTVYCLCMSGSFLFCYCYFSEQSTRNYLAFERLLFESNWYRLPLGHQKAMLMMIAAAQRPLCYNGSGVAYLNLNTFCRVSSFGYSKRTILGRHSRLCFIKLRRKTSRHKLLDLPKNSLHSMEAFFCQFSYFCSFTDNQKCY